MMIPPYIKKAIDGYVDHGWKTGGFLTAVLSNDLFEAAAKADAHSQIALAEICQYIYNYTPSDCWGGEEHIEVWLELWKEKPKAAERLAAVDRDEREKYYMRLYDVFREDTYLQKEEQVLLWII